MVLRNCALWRIPNVIKSPNSKVNKTQLLRLILISNFNTLFRENILSVSVPAMLAGSWSWNVVSHLHTCRRRRFAHGV